MFVEEAIDLTKENHLLAGRWLNHLSMEKLDLAKEDKTYYSAKPAPNW